MRVLVADDEKRYRDYLSATFSGRGHEVVTVETGRDAIDTGVRFHPDILIADWMLKNNIHGLQVSDVLRAIDSTLQTILMTGFSSTDLTSDAKDAQVFQFMAKPFELEDMVEAVQKSATYGQTKPATDLFAVIEVDTTGVITGTNGKARRFLAGTKAGSSTRRLEDFIGPSAGILLDECCWQWTEVKLLTLTSSKWWMRSRKLGAAFLVVLLSESQSLLRRDPRIELLLEIDEPKEFRWPFKDHVLVIDDEKLLRLLYARLLGQIGCRCYKAETKDLALKLFKADPDIGVVILDYEMPGVVPGLLVQELRTIRPNVTIVGSSGKAQASDFARIGVHRFLAKPWRISQLIELLKKGR